MTVWTIDEIRDGFDALNGTGAGAIVGREVISVQGPDAGRYLQGQLSQDVMAMSGPSAWSFILQPNGKVSAWLRVHRLADDDFRLEVEPGFGEVLLARLRRFLLRTDATIGEPQTWALVCNRWDPLTPKFGAEDHPGVLRGSPVGPGVAGSDLLLAVGEGAAAKYVDSAVVSPASFERHRIAHGVPALGAELTDETIPGEAGAWAIEASVSFTKGCYTGQELVARIDSRGGNVPRPVRLIEIQSGYDIGSGPSPGDEIRQGDAAIGSVTSAAPCLGDSHPALVLAPVARSAEIGSTVQILSGGTPVSGIIVDTQAGR